MKWLIFLMLVSCGVKNPPAKDVSDSDGDQIPNYLESDSELQKYVAEVIPFGKTEGSLSFKLENKIVSVKIGNEHDIAENAMKLLTRTLSTIKSGDYFSEWSLLKVETSSFVIPDGKYEVTLALETNERPKLLTLTDGKAEVEIGNFSKRMEFQVTAEELRQILAEKINLKMKKTQEENPYSVESTIRERTYRVFYFDGRVSKIHYVSHELEFSRYLQLSGIHESYELKSFRGFTQDDPRAFWWTRNVGEKDKIVVKGSLKTLSEFNASNFVIKESVIDRRNGSAVNSLSVKKIASSKFVVKVRGKKIQNHFKESSRGWHMGGARGELSEDCRDWSRSVVSSTTSSVTKEELLSQMIIQTTEKSEPLNELSGNVTEGMDEKGRYLELAMDETPEEFTILLAPRPQGTYVKTGIFKKMCTHWDAPKYGGDNTNEEGQMDLSLESFIEKID